jgi:hypothetical protein
VIPAVISLQVLIVLEAPSADYNIRFELARGNAIDGKPLAWIIRSAAKPARRLGSHFRRGAISPVSLAPAEKREEPLPFLNKQIKLQNTTKDLDSQVRFLTLTRRLAPWNSAKASVENA